MVPPSKNRKRFQLSQESLDALLSRLDPDRERAGEIYEELRKELTSYFARHGCADPASLAEKTLDRGATRIREGAPIVSEIKYFYGIARNVFHEYLRKQALSYDPPPLRDPHELEIENECLRKCGERQRENYELVSSYFPLDKQARLEMARRLGISIKGLRSRINRARSELRNCLRKCIERAQPEN